MTWRGAVWVWAWAWAAALVIESLVADRACGRTEDLPLLRFELERLISIALIQSLDHLHLCVLLLGHRDSVGAVGRRRRAATGERSGAEGSGRSDDINSKG